MTVKIKEFPGVGLKESDFEEKKILFTELLDPVLEVLLGLHFIAGVGVHHVPFF